MRKKINKDMLIADIVENYPEIVEVLVDDYGFHCVGCFAAAMETLEQGAEVHDMTKEEIGKMVETLNGILEDSEKEKIKNE